MTKTILIGIIAMTIISGTSTAYAITINLEGDVTTPGDYSYSGSQTRTMTICPWNGVPLASFANVETGSNCRLNVFHDNPVTGFASAGIPVNGLPEGATITGFSCGIIDNGANADGKFICTLYRESPTSGHNAVAQTPLFTSSGSSGIVQQLVAASIDIPTVDNNFGYNIQYGFQGDGTTDCSDLFLGCHFHMAKITYTVSKSD